MNITRTTALWTTRGALAVGAVALLAACGSSPAASNDPGQSGDSGGYAGPGGSGQGFRPGASGQVAAINGSTAEVQNTQLQQQVAVSWNKSTVFTAEVPASRSAVKVGSCVVVSAPRTTSSGAPTAVPTAAPTAITAATVRITPATNGSCTGGFGAGRRGQGGQPGGQFTPRPGSQFSGGGQGRRGGFRGFGAFGKVTSVSASGFTVQSDFGGQSGSPTTITVTTTGSTTYTTTATATASAMKQGVCVQAMGNADSTGAVTASRIAISQPVDGACSGGFGPRG